MRLNEKNLPLGIAEGTSQATRPKLNEDNPRAAFIATWRFWRNWAASRHADFALYPVYAVRKSILDEAAALPNLARWGAQMAARPGVQKGLQALA